MRQAATTLDVATAGQRLYEITRDVTRWVADQAMAEGLLTLFCRHTSASLLIQEVAFFARIAPEDPSRYAHADEGPDEMPAHL